MAVVSAYSHKKRPPTHEIAGWLEAHHQARVFEVSPIRGGYWSTAWSYRLGEADLILRLGDTDDGYRIDEAAECQGPVETERGRSVELNGGGRESCAVVAIGTARWC